MSLKIGLVTGEFPPMEGGVGAFTSELAKALASLGHEIHIITSRKARSSEARRKFWEPHEPIDIGYAQLHPRVNRWHWSAVSAIASVALLHELEVINVQYQAAAYDMKLPGINFLPWRLREVTSTVVTFHDLRVPYLFPKAGGLRPWIVHQLARSAEGVIVTNATDYQELQRLGLDPRGIRQIPIGSNIKASAPSSSRVKALREQLGLGPSDLLLGYFGFLNASKGADILLRTLKQLADNVHLVFIGGQTGSSDPENQAYLTEVEKLVDGLQLQTRVHWSGFLADAALSTYFNAADIMVMPYRDGVSLRRGTLMAILAHGRPLITTKPSTPLEQLVHGENVWLTRVDDPNALRDAIQQLAIDDDLRVRLGSGAKQLSRLFTWDKIALETATFFTEIRTREGSAGQN